MRHGKSGRKLGRNSSHRKAMYRNMVTSLLDHERIETTLAKAKELRGKTERNISIALRLGDLLEKDKEKEKDKKDKKNPCWNATMSAMVTEDSSDKE